MKTLCLTAALLGATALPALAGEAWESIRTELYGDRTLMDGTDVIAIDAPYRSQDDARTDIAAFISAPHGMNVGKVTVVLDDNPMPVSAVFDLDTPQPRFFFDATLRVNGPTPLRVIAETTDGQLWMSETFVKTSGKGACSAPPGTDPTEALATLGNMEIDVDAGIRLAGVQPLDALSLRQRKLNVDIQHPSHSGMQMDQISLLFIPMRYVEQVDIDLDGAGYVGITGSISLSENPRIGVSVPASTQSVDVTMTDTSGTVSQAHKKLAGY